jgi:spermidine synthase
MKFLNKTALLFIVIILEGYVVLSSEMLAIRQTIPFVGSGTDTVSIVIAAVLMPLAFGYYAGGRFKAGPAQNIRGKLVTNIVIAQAIFMVGLSYYPLSTFFFSLMELGIKNRLALTTIYALLFLVVPVYLLGQTIPLVSNYFLKQRLSRITGRMLFLSTLGSFLGAVFSTLVLMAFVGVHYTVVILSALLTILVLLLSRRRMPAPIAYSFIILLFTFLANSDSAMKKFNIVEDNQYNNVMVLEDAYKNRHMMLNLTASSMYNDAGGKHKYIEFVEKQLIDPIREGREPKEILVIGAGAFTFGHGDDFNNYDYVDLDASLQKISEDYILKDKLGKTKHFHAMEARAFLAGTDKKYDAVFLDAYNGDLTIPEHLVTKEFYMQVRNHMKDHGTLAGNFILSPNFESIFSRTLDNTIRSVFPYVSRHIISQDYSMWNESENLITNVIYLYTKHPEENTDKVYTDNRNTIFYDKPQTR